jgi:hypothetical protein
MVGGKMIKLTTSKYYYEEDYDTFKQVTYKDFEVEVKEIDRECPLSEVNYYDEYERR